MNFDLTYEVLVVPALWAMLLIAVIVLAFRKRWKTLGITFALGALAVGSLVVVPPGHRGALYQAVGGVQETERPEGFSFVIPIVQSVNMVNVREQLYSNDEVFGQTKDVLEVTMQVGVNYAIIPTQAAEIFRDVGQEYEARIIENAVLDVGKQVIGQYEASEAPFKRSSITADMLAGLQARLEPVGIQVTFVALRDIILPEEFVEAVKLKEIANEKAEESRRLVQVALNEAQQVRARAAGEADAKALEGEGQSRAIDAVANALGFSPDEYLRWLQLQVWNGVLPETLVTSGNNELILGLE
jgi:regulator of protease activity HflC (stomatin/prohibitin superfamily)